jgi:hypothetical protein
MNDNGAPDGIELADAVQAVRDQLLAASARDPRGVAFDVGEIHMEFAVELRVERKASAKVRAWVVDAGADASRTSARTHRISFTLVPKDAVTGAAWKVGNATEGSTAHFGRGTEPRRSN